jgi:hypothetical protein
MSGGGAAVAGTDWMTAPCHERHPKERILGTPACNKHARADYFWWHCLEIKDATWDIHATDWPRVGGWDLGSAGDYPS